MTDDKAADVAALRQAFADAGLSAEGIDLEWLVAFKVDTESKIAAARSDAAFAAAKPFFVRFGQVAERDVGGGNGTA